MSLHVAPKVTNEHDLYPIPLKDSFDDQDYLPAHDLDMLLSRLLDQHESIFSHLVDLKITCLWKAKGGASKGKQTLGKIQRATGLIAYFSEVDFIIWLAADHLQEAEATNLTIEACLFHEACHLQWDAENGKVLMVNHDFEGFTEELRVYGLWRSELQKASTAFVQLSLIGA